MLIEWRMRIAFVGDSLVNGTSDPEYLGWPGRVCREAAAGGFDITYYNLGVRGETSRDIRRRWLAEAEPRLPAEYGPRIVFSFGTNDGIEKGGALRVPTAETLENTRAVLTEASELWPTLMIGPPPVADPGTTCRNRALTESFRFLCRDIDVPFLDVFTPLAASDTWMREVVAGDGHHPDAAGYAELAGLVSAWDAWRAWFKG